jgi:branched-subunit amino acid ABC-type transport system permease component
MNIQSFCAQFISGLNSAAILFMLGAGLSLAFGVLHILNMAHGSFYLLGAFAAIAISHLLASWGGIAFWISLTCAPVVIGLLGGVVEFTLLRRIYSRHLLYQLLITFSLVYVLSDVMKIIWGGAAYAMRKPQILTPSALIMGRPVPIYSLFTIASAVVVALALWAFLTKTKYGTLIRAIEQDREMSEALGINTKFLSTVVFAMGTFLAGFGGAVAAGSQAIGLGLDVEVTIPAFVVVLIGGMGNLGGVVIGALIIGMADAFGILILPELSLAFMYLILAIVLIIRPWGLLGIAR